MTSEKAIQLLHRLQDEQFDGIHGDERREALEMAVSALVEPNIGQKTIDCIIKRLNDEDNTVGDTIYRQDAIDAVDVKCLHRGIVKGIQGIIEDLPSAQPERKKGRWLPDNNCYYETRYMCSECKLPFHVDTIMMKPSWRFCPHCGARMGENE